MTNLEAQPELVALEVCEDGYLGVILFTDRWADRHKYLNDPDHPAIFPMLDEMAKEFWPPMHDIRLTSIRMALDATLQDDKLNLAVEPRASFDAYRAQNRNRTYAAPLETVRNRPAVHS